jgi:hypothetical protein
MTRHSYGTIAAFLVWLKKDIRVREPNLKLMGITSLDKSGREMIFLLLIVDFEDEFAGHSTVKIRNGEKRYLKSPPLGKSFYTSGQSMLAFPGIGVYAKPRNFLRKSRSHKYASTHFVFREL